MNRVGVACAKRLDAKNAKEEIAGIPGSLNRYLSFFPDDQLPFKLN